MIIQFDFLPRASSSSSTVDDYYMNTLAQYKFCLSEPLFVFQLSYSAGRHPLHSKLYVRLAI